MPVQLEYRDAVALLTLDRPETLNALSPDMIADLDARLDEIAAQPGARCVVITGAGTKAFSAGADLSVVQKVGALEARGFAAAGQAVITRIEEFPAPVIAAVNGYALGGGCELALGCDIRLAADTARFGQPEVKVGILPGWGATQRLPRLTSPAFAKEAIFTGRMIGAEEAARVGLANHVHPQAELLDRAIEMANEIASQPTWAIAASKSLCNLAYEGDLAGHLARELDVFALAFTTPDQREGMTAFLEKRPAKFEGH